MSQSQRVARDNRRIPKRKRGVRSAREQELIDARLGKRGTAARERAAAFVAALRRANVTHGARNDV